VRGKVSGTPQLPGVTIYSSTRRHRLRTPARLIVAAATALSLMAAVSPAQAAGHPASSRLSATATPTTLLPHSTVVIAGTVAPRGTGVVLLQRYVSGQWLQLSHKTTSRTGSYSFSLRTSAVLGTTIYRVARAASSAAKAVVSKTVHVLVTKTVFKVKAAARPAVAAGTPIVVTGSVANKAKGFVLLEVLQHGVWKDIATGRLSASSTFSFSHVLPAGTYALRVRKPLTTTVASGVSTAIKVTVTAPLAAAPTAAISLAGTLVSTGIYSGTVTATATTKAAAGVKSISYVLDGAAAKPYTAAIPVSATGKHTLTVTVTDKDLRTATATSSWTIQSAQGQPGLPTATVSLAGTHYTGTVYGGAVTVTVAATAEAGIKTVTYSLDGAAAVPYTGAVVVQPTASSARSLTATVTDQAGNVATASTSWSEIPPDVAPPTASITLAGSLVSGTTYAGTVTATVTAADTGGSGLKPVSYELDNGQLHGAVTPYTVPIAVTAAGTYTLTLTLQDNAGNVPAAAVTKTWTIQGPDTTKPTASINLAGTVVSPGVYSGNVTVTINASDASGIKSVKYVLDSGSSTTYTGAFSVTSAQSHTITATATDNANNSFTTPETDWSQQASAGSPDLVISTTDQAVLGQAGPRLVFSTWRGSTDPVAPKLVTLTNNGTSALAVSNVAITGADATSYAFSDGQPLSFSIAAGGSATVSVVFQPTQPTNCPSGTSGPSSVLIGVSNRDATLSFSTNDATQPSGSTALSGINACGQGGNGEPVLDQVLQGLGYTDAVDNGFDDRYLGPSRYFGSNTDEIESPYFVAANAAVPVSLVPVAHYGSGNASNAYQSTGWYAQGAAMNEPSSTCNTTACKLLWQFPADTMVGTTLVYNQNQKLLPTPTGTTTFTPPTPTTAFGVFSSDFSEVNFTDDSLNVANNTNNVPMAVPHYLHNMRIYPAYGPGHVIIPNSYLVTDDLSRVPAFKNNDYQDVVLLLSNVRPATAQARVVNTTNDSLDLTSGISVGGDCSVTGFDGVMGNTGGNNPCVAGNISTSGAGLSLTSTPGQLADNNQVNALYQNFDASRGPFTISTTVIGSVNQVTQNYQQIAAFFGPDDKNFIKIEAEHNNPTAGSPPQLTLFYDENGVSTSAAITSPPGLATATTLDLVIKGNPNVPDPIPTASDTDKVRGYPLDELTVWYSLNGGTLTQIGTTIEFPKNVSGWFSRSAKAGILVANPGTATSLTATFSRFSIASG
jgi:hypothetical protein